MPPSVAPYFCPLTNRIRTDERTKAFLKRVGFSLQPSKSHGLDVPVLRSAAHLQRAMEACTTRSTDPAAVADRGTKALVAARHPPRKVLVSDPFRRLLHASVKSKLGTAPWSDTAALERAIEELTATRLANVLTTTITRDAQSPRRNGIRRNAHRDSRPALQDLTPDDPLRDSALANRRGDEEDVAALRCGLTADQCAALDICLSGRHVYIGGNAGTGKSFALKRIAAALTAAGKRVLRTAMTGIAALQIDGTTLHHALTISIPRRTAVHAVPPSSTALSTDPMPASTEEYTVDSIGIKGAMRNIDVLLIDEVSMLDATLLTAIHDVAQRYAASGPARRRSELPFGGNLQVILCGDFMQLLPQSRSILHLPLFHQTFTHVALTTPMRQSGNTEFFTALNALRLGELPNCIATSAATNPAAPDAVRLYPTRRSAEAYNSAMMSKLEGKAVALKSLVRIESAAVGWSAAVTLQLCMCRSLKAQRSVEGTVRRALVEEHGYANDDLGFLFAREPLGSVVTMVIRAKSWGKQLAKDTLTHLQASVEHVFRHRVASPGVTVRCETSGTGLARSARDLVYQHACQKVQRDSFLGTKRLKAGCRVMLVRNLNDSLVNGLVGTVLRFVQPGTEVVEWQRYGVQDIRRTLQSGRRLSAMPLVKFDRVEEPVVVPYVQLPVPEVDTSGFVDVRVSAMPLVPAYAFTVHKAQGVTFDTDIVVDCAHMWPCHHLVYVAASRVRRLDQLRMVRLQPQHVSVCSDCLAFSQQLLSASTVASTLLHSPSGQPHPSPIA